MKRLVVQGKTEGKRRSGILPTRWMDVVKKVLDTKIENAYRIIEHRSRWRDVKKRAINQLENNK